MIISLLLAFQFHKTFVFKEKDGILSIQTFYKCRENSVDVLFLGSSHVFMNVNNGVLWTDYGMASFDLCASGQPAWNIYYYLKEALKTQKPELLVVDCFTMAKDNEFSEIPSVIKSTYGMKLSKNKLDAIKVSVPKDDYMDFWLEYPTYHSRYEEISRLDFDKYIPDNYYPEWKGQIISPYIKEFEKPIDIDSDEKVNLNPKSEEYYRKIIELAKEENIPIMLMIAPYVVSKEHMSYFNTMADIAAEYNVPFVNFNYDYDGIGLDFSRDFADGEHLNNKGSIKFSKYLGEYIKTYYEVSDRSGQPGYEDYDVCANITFMKDYDVDVKTTTELSELINMAGNENYVVYYILKGDFNDISNKDYFKNALAQNGIICEDYSDFVKILKGKDILWDSDNAPLGRWIYEMSDLHTLTVEKDGNAFPSVRTNSVLMTPEENALIVYIYDAARNEGVVKRVFRLNNGEILTEG